MTTDRCDLSDLPVEQCTCAKHKPETRSHQPMEIEYRFDARFDSECDSCGELMDRGDRIGRTTDGDYVCERCCEEEG